MSTFHATTRQPRGRALIVGEVAAADSLHTMTQRIVTADDLYDAIGHIASASTREPIQVVLIPTETLSDHNAEAVAAMRRVDPSLRIYGLANGEVIEMDHAVRAQLDDVINATLDAQLIDTLLVAESPQMMPTRAPDSQPADRDATAADEAEQSAPYAAPEPAAPTAELPPDEPAHELHSEAPAAAAHEPPAQEDVEQDVLGDIDLVEAIMHRPGSVRDLAMQLMKQQTGWSDVRFNEKPDPDQAGLCVEVEYGGRTFGTLCTDVAEPKQLAMWAHWLGTWLALDNSQRQLRTMAYRDHLTGAWSRRFYDVYVANIIEQARRRREPVTIMVFDIDDFKVFNDRFGHDAGDEILIETVRLLNSVIREDDRVCRIGGDEFAVIFWDPQGPREPGSHPLESVESIAKRFQEQICKLRFPKLGPEAPGTLSISAGLSTYPWDGNDPETLLRHADQLALQSKRKGKNVLTFGPGTQRICNDE